MIKGILVTVTLAVAALLILGAWASRHTARPASGKARA
jgi:hypothetical protein